MLTCVQRGWVLGIGICVFARAAHQLSAEEDEGREGRMTLVGVGVACSWAVAGGVFAAASSLHRAGVNRGVPPESNRAIHTAKVPPGRIGALRKPAMRLERPRALTHPSEMPQA